MPRQVDCLAEMVVGSGAVPCRGPAARVEGRQSAKQQQILLGGRLNSVNRFEFDCKSPIPLPLVLSQLKKLQ